MVALLWLLLLLPFGAGLLAQRRVQERYARYGAVPNHRRVTGAEAARALLDAHRLPGVRIERAPGVLTDHYDGAADILRLSQGVAEQRSVAALAIAAHEVAHAYQDAEGSRVYRLRVTIGEPLAKVSPWSGLFFIGGFWFGIPLLMVLAVAYVCGMVLFALATLPVEFGASRRALRILESTGLTDATETEEVRQVLRAAALTYIAGLLRQIGLFCALILVAAAAQQVSG